MLVAYARAYLDRYIELVERHVPQEHRRAFAFSRDVGYGLRIIASRTHGAAAIFDPGLPRSLWVISTDDRIEFRIWPRTKSSWTNRKTTFVSEEDDLTIFAPGKGFYAGGSLKIEYRGRLIYEGRMVLKGSTSAEEWSPAAANFDALHTFLRAAREIIANQVTLAKIESQGNLEVRARAAALARTARGDKETIENPWAYYEEYFELADELGVNPFVAMRRLDDIIQETSMPSPQTQFSEQWVRPVIQNVVAGLVALALGAAVAFLSGALWVGIVVILVALLLATALRRSRRGAP
jgi:hypothetical protein